MKYAPTFLLAAALVAGAARADTALIGQWNTETVVEALRALGATDIQVSRPGVEPSVIAKTADGLSVGLYGRSCQPTADDRFDCRGIEGLISYDVARRLDRVAAVDRLNHRFAAGKFILESGGALRLTRYIGLEGGVANANLTSQLRDFFSLGALTAQTLWPQTTPSAPPPSPPSRPMNGAMLP